MFSGLGCLPRDHPGNVKLGRGSVTTTEPWRLRVSPAFSSSTALPARPTAEQKESVWAKRRREPRGDENPRCAKPGTPAAPGRGLPHAAAADRGGRASAPSGDADCTHCTRVCPHTFIPVAYPHTFLHAGPVCSHQVIHGSHHTTLAGLRFALTAPYTLTRTHAHTHTVCGHTRACVAFTLTVHTHTHTAVRVHARVHTQSHSHAHGACTPLPCH